METQTTPQGVTMTEAQYASQPESYRGVWTTERDDLPNWAAERHLYLGKRTLLAASGKGGTCLLIEGLGLEITP
ncbi:hypothetical protein [Acidovorax sp. sic0104]|uniref:hypothetical protein n=1 Tax=Acidovorax sp. sic0104 TaxID=2854784 RepID=UPI001C4705F4|nr:hypothetical protein [Acidovorax sp. sic0104]MBV7542156.1 hypothetical protein [Acidovorax sp. sic0104]